MGSLVAVISVSLLSRLFLFSSHSCLIFGSRLLFFFGLWSRLALISQGYRGRWLGMLHHATT